MTFVFPSYDGKFTVVISDSTIFSTPEAAWFYSVGKNLKQKGASEDNIAAHVEWLQKQSVINKLRYQKNILPVECKYKLFLR